jgi:hypothetical protein
MRKGLLQVREAIVVVDRELASSLYNHPVAIM